MARTTTRIRIRVATLLAAASLAFAAQPLQYRYQRTYGSKHGIQPPKILNRKAAKAAVGEAVHPYGLGFPVAVTTDLRGRVWITDNGTNSVHVFGEAGFYREIRRTPDGELQQPAGIATDSSGHVYVVDSALGQVFVFDEKGEYERTLIGRREARILKRPTWIAITRNRRTLYVADPDSRAVFAFNQEGEVNSTIALPADLGEPAAMTVVENDLYVLGRGQAGARVFTATGNPRGSRNWGEIRFPMALAWDGCRFAVANPRWMVVEIYNAAGESVGVFGQTGDGVDQVRRIDSLYMDDRGSVYVVDSREGKVLVFADPSLAIPPVAPGATSKLDEPPRFASQPRLP